MIFTIAKYLWIIGSLPLIILGATHLMYTFFTNKFSSRNNVVEQEMKTSFPVLTKATTMWKAWIGFNASHSAGCIYIGVINLIVAIEYEAVLQSAAFLSLNITTILFYCWLAKKYWFRIPLTGVLIATCCFIAAAVLISIS